MFTVSITALVLSFLSFLSLVISVPVLFRSGVSFSVYPGGMASTLHYYHTDTLFHECIANGTLHDGILNTSSGDRQLVHIPAIDLRESNRSGILLQTIAGISLFAVSTSNRDAPIRIWNENLTCKPLELLRLDGVEFYPCVNYAENRIDLFTVDVTPFSISDYHTYSIGSLTMDPDAEPLNMASNFIPVSFVNRHYVIFGLANRIYYFAPFLYASGVFAEPIPEEQCPWIHQVDYQV